DSKEMVWYASCEHRYPGDPPGGTALHCTAHNGYVLGRIDDENPANADEDCGATMSYRPGYPLPMGATRNSRKVMSIAATAPITKGLGLVVRPSGNPFNSACEAPTFSSPDPGKRYFISIFTGWGSGPRREHWTGTAQPGLGLARTTATFDGELDVGIWSGVPNRSVGEQILVAVKDMLAGWWTSLADGFASTAPPKIFSPAGGTLDVTATARGRRLQGTTAGHDGCPAESGVYGSDYGALFNLNDLTKGWSAGMAFPGLHNTACIGIVPTKVAPGEVDFRLGAFYTNLYPKFSLDTGDHVQLVVDGAVRDTQVTYSAPETSEKGEAMIDHVTANVGDSSRRSGSTSRRSSRSATRCAGSSGRCGLRRP